MPYDVTVTDAAPRTIACTWSEVAMADLGEAIGCELGLVWDWLDEHDVTQTGHNIVVYLDGDPLLLDCMFGVEVLTVVEPQGAVMISQTPAGPVATTTHWGDYAGVPEAHAAVRAWCEANGRALEGANWEVYGDWAENPAQRRVDVFHLLET